jgi:hypothetical protein
MTLASAVLILVEGVREKPGNGTSTRYSGHDGARRR